MTFSSLLKDTSRANWEDIPLPYVQRVNPPGGSTIPNEVFVTVWDFTLDTRWRGLNVVMLAHVNVNAADTNGAVIAFSCQMANGDRGTSCTARQVTSPNDWPAGGGYSRAHFTGMWDGEVPANGRCIVRIRIDGFGNSTIVNGTDNQSSIIVYPYGVD